MARLPRICLPGITQHVNQRGNNRQACFGSDEDFAAYASWLDEYARQFQVAIHAWVFMTNHVHLLVTPKTGDGISSLMQKLGRRYVRCFNYTYRRSGTLWEGRFKSCVVDADNYLLLCQRYIELNPVSAGMVLSPGDYHWSSYGANGLGRSATFWTPHPLYLSLGQTPTKRSKVYRALFRYEIEQEVLTDIQQSTDKGMALGNERFKEEIERLSGRRVVNLRHGPKARADTG